jgi:hypothetical protein
MPSRMERYYQSLDNEDKKTSRRTLINKDLYNNIYDEAEYSNVEGIASIDKTNEIDINKIKEMLKQRELKEGIKTLVKENAFDLKQDFHEETKKYDIREMLEQAKENKDDYLREKPVLRTTQYYDETIKRDALKFKELDQEEEESLKELINTITNTSMINKMNEKELPLEILSDLKSNHTETITTDNESIRKIIEAQREKEKKEDKKEVLDKSFYTSGISFNDQDFEIIKPDAKEEVSLVVKVIIFMMLVIITAGVILGIIMFLK